MTQHRSHLRAALLGATALFGALALSAGSAAAQDREFTFDLPAQPLGASLRLYARTAQEQVIFTDAAVRGRTAPALTGTYSAEEALQTLLAGTDLNVHRTASGIVQVTEAADPQGGSGAGGAATVEALIVTAQKKEEAIQDVPIAISAFTQKDLDAQKLEGGFDLLKAIPNVSFSKNNFTGYNFSIRGVGTKAVSATTDPGVAVSFNNTTLIVNRLFEQEYFDVERVEVLRGPQGTLYGRNATSGVINVLSARPRLGEFEGEVKLEVGNYNARRLRAMVNLPVGDTFAVRLAGAVTKRDGYGVNEAAGTENDLNGVSEDVDDRDLWSFRATAGWEPIEALRVNALWERFEEDDSRTRTSKQLCHNDPGPQQVGDFNWDQRPNDIIFRGLTSQGCLAGSLYDDGAYDTPNGASLPYVNALYIGPRFGIAYSYPFAMGLSPIMLGQMTGTPVEARCDALSEAVSDGLPGTFPLDLCQPDPYAGLAQSRDLRSIYSLIQPQYRAKADIFELTFDLDLTDEITLTSQTVFTKDSYYATQDFNRFTTYPIFEDSLQSCDPTTALASLPTFNCVPWVNYTNDPGAPNFFFDSHNIPGGYANLLPGGVFTDPQLGPSRTLVAQDLAQSDSEQFNQEFRLVSDFDSSLNFSLGANFTRFDTRVDYYVFSNALTLLTNFYPFKRLCDEFPACVYVDPNPLESIDGDGHNYFRSANPYQLTSSAVFGEVYWQATDTVKVTLGGRMSWDRKVFTPIPSQLLLIDYREFPWHEQGNTIDDTCPYPGNETENTFCPLAGNASGGKGYPANPDIVQEWREPTGRLIVDWKPDLSFTDETMVYASMSHGYKGGGANPPGIAPPSYTWNAANSVGAAPPTFEPEFVNAFEIGSKNTLLGGAMILNGAAFYYDYEGYQVSKIVDRSAANENFDAKIWGAELEWLFSPTRNLRFNGTFGALRTEIADGERSLDLMDRTQGGGADFWIDADGARHELEYDQWVVLKSWVTNSSNCIAPLEVVEALLQYHADNPSQNYGGATMNLCPAGGLNSTSYRIEPVPGLGRTYNPVTEAPNGGAGFYDEIGGNELPNAPRWTASFGAQYRFALPAGWDATLRGDFYWQAKSYARVHNSEYDRLKAWKNANISLWFENPGYGVTAEVYVKNAFEETPITDAFLNSDDTGLTTNVFTLDPRLVGVSVKKTF